MLDALDEERRSEQKSKKKKDVISRKLLMIPENRQTEEQHLKVEQISKEYPKTGRAFRMVQAIDTVYASENIEVASNRLNQLYCWLRRSRLEPMKNAL